MKIFISKRLFLVDCFIFCTPHSFANNNNISRLPNGKPDFNGVWQVLNKANYNIEPHAASSAMSLKDALYGSLPSDEVVSLGVVGSIQLSLCQ